jgi:malate/lactate dehydrogenase
MIQYNATDTIVIIGAGNVGKALLNNLIAKRIFKEIHVTRADKQKLTQYVADSKESAYFNGVSIHGFESMNDIPPHATCIVAASAEFDYAEIAQKNGVNLRESILQYEAPVIRSIAEGFACRDNEYEGHVFMITNPTETMSGVFHTYSGIPAERIHPFGAMLDSVRAEMAYMDRHADEMSIEVTVIGEHGPSGFIAPELSTISDAEAEELTRESHRRGADIAAELGYATGVSGVLIQYLEQLQRGWCERIYIPFGTYHLDMFIEVPARLQDGNVELRINDLENDSLERLKASVDKVKALHEKASDMLSR